MLDSGSERLCAHSFTRATRLSRLSGLALAWKMKAKHAQVAAWLNGFVLLNSLVGLIHRVQSRPAYVQVLSEMWKRTHDVLLATAARNLDNHLAARLEYELQSFLHLSFPDSHYQVGVCFERVAGEWQWISPLIGLHTSITSEGHDCSKLLQNLGHYPLQCFSNGSAFIVKGRKCPDPGLPLRCFWVRAMIVYWPTKGDTEVNYADDEALTRLVEFKKGHHTAQALMIHKLASLERYIEIKLKQPTPRALIAGAKEAVAVSPGMSKLFSCDVLSDTTYKTRGRKVEAALQVWILPAHQRAQGQEDLHAFTQGIQVFQLQQSVWNCIASGRLEAALAVPGNDLKNLNTVISEELQECLSEEIPHIFWHGKHLFMNFDVCAWVQNIPEDLKLLAPANSAEAIQGGRVYFGPPSNCVASEDPPLFCIITGGAIRVQASIAGVIREFVVFFWSTREDRDEDVALHALAVQHFNEMFSGPQSIGGDSQEVEIKWCESCPPPTARVWADRILQPVDAENGAAMYPPRTMVMVLELTHGSLDNDLLGLSMRTGQVVLASRAYFVVDRQVSDMGFDMPVYFHVTMVTLPGP